MHEDVSKISPVAIQQGGRLESNVDGRGEGVQSCDEMMWSVANRFVRMFVVRNFLC